MTFCFDINSKRVEYKYDPILGIIKISVNGSPVSRQFVAVGGPKTSNIRIDGRDVRILMDQPVLLPLLRKKTYKVYIDNKLCMVFDKRGRLIQTKDA